MELKHSDNVGEIPLFQLLIVPYGIETTIHAKSSTL